MSNVRRGRRFGPSTDSSRIAATLPNARLPPLFLLIICCFYVHVSATSLTIRVRSFNESSVLFSVASTEQLLPEFLSLQGRAVGASTFSPVQCSSIQKNALASNSWILSCSIIAFVNYEVVASYDLPSPGFFKSPLVLASTGFPVAAVPPPIAAETNESAVLLQWSNFLDVPSPSVYAIFSQRAGFPFKRSDVPRGAFSHWSNGFSLKESVNFILMGCNQYSSSLQLDGLTCVNSTIVSVTLNPVPPPPTITVHPLPNCKLLVLLQPDGGIQVTEFFLSFSIDGIVVLTFRTKEQNLTTPSINCPSSVLVEAGARNLNSAGFSDSNFVSAYAQVFVPSPKSLISRVSIDSVTFTWQQPHKFGVQWRYAIDCLVNGIPGCLRDAVCLSSSFNVNDCLEYNEILLEEEYIVFSPLSAGTNITISVRSIDTLGYRSTGSVVATGISGQRIADIYVPTINSVVLINAHCASILWKSLVPIIPSWSYLQMSAEAHSKSGSLVASVSFSIAESSVLLCSIPSGMTVSLTVILSTSMGDQVSSSVHITTPITLPESHPAKLITRWVSWQASSLCIAGRTFNKEVTVSSYDLLCDSHFVAKFDPSLARAIDVAYFFGVSDFTSALLLGSTVNYTCFVVTFPIYLQPSSCSVVTNNANYSIAPPISTVNVKYQPAANFSVSVASSIIGVTESCIVFDVSTRGKILQDALMYVESSETIDMANVHKMSPYSLSSSSHFVSFCPNELAISIVTPLFFRIYFSNLNNRSNLIQNTFDPPLLNHPIFPKPYPPSPIALRVEFTESGSSNILVWELSSANNDLDGFQILFKNASTPVWMPFSGILFSNQSSFVLNEITKGTRYFFKIHSISVQHYPRLNPVGSEAVSFSLESIPGSVSDVKSIIASFDTVTLSWNTVSYPRALAFHVFCNSSSLNQSTQSGSTIISSAKVSIRVGTYSTGTCSICACADLICYRKSRPSSIDFNITKDPTPVAGLFVTNLNEFSVSLRWSGSDHVTDYLIFGTPSLNYQKVCMCNIDSVFNCTSCIISLSLFAPIVVPSSQTSLNVSGLKSGFSYLIFVFSRSSNGSRWIGNSSSVVAAVPVPPPRFPPVDLALINISSQFAFIEWRGSLSPDAPTEYRVLLLPNGISQNASIFYITTSNSQAKIIFQLQNLQIGLNYSVVVKGRNQNAAGYNTPSSNEAVLNISVVPPCLPPIQIRVVNVTVSSVFVSWDMDTNGPEVLQILAFYCFHDVKLIPQPSLSSVTLPKDQRSYNFTGLQLQQTYIFSVATIGLNANYSTSTISIISQAQQSFSSPPLNLSLLFVNETVFDIAWNAPNSKPQPQYFVSPPPISYEVYICQNSCMTGEEFPQTARPNDLFVDSYGDLYRWSGLEWAVVVPLVNSYTLIASLSFSSRSFSYKFANVSSLYARVCAFNFNREQPPSKVNCAYLRNVRVQGLAPTPLLVAGTNPTTTTISLIWVVTCPDDLGDCLRDAFFNIQYSVFGSGIWIDYSETSPTSSIMVKNLSPGTTYIFRVSSLNRAGMSPWSEPSQPSPSSTTFNTPKNIRVSGIIRAVGSRDVNVSIFWEALPNIDSHLFKVEFQVPGVANWNIATSGTKGSRFSVTVPDFRIFGSNGAALTSNSTNPLAAYQFRVTGGTERYGIDPVDVSNTILVILPALPMLPPSVSSVVLANHSNTRALFVIAAPQLSQPMLGLSSQLYFRAFLSSNEFSSGLSSFDDSRAVFLDQWAYPVYSTNLNLEIDGLMMNISYILRVQTITGNLSVFSDFFALRFQLAPVPGPPQNLSIFAVTLNSVTVTWSPPGSAVSSYLLLYSLNSSTFISAGDVGASNEGTIHNLPSFTTIVIAVRARSLHSDGFGIPAKVLAYPTISCDAESTLNLSWANATHAMLTWSRGNFVCVRVQRFQILVNGIWTNFGSVLDSYANSSVISCSARNSLQVRRVSWSFNFQDIGIASAVVDVSCVEKPLPVKNLVISETFESSCILQFDHEVDPNGMSRFKVDTHCPNVSFHSSTLHEIGSHLNHEHVRLLVTQVPIATPCQIIVYHGNSHSSGIETQGSLTSFFTIELPIEWRPENVSLVGYEFISENYVDITFSYVLKDPRKVSFVGVFLIADEVSLLHEEPSVTALKQITAPNISAHLRSCFAVYCRNLNSIGYSNMVNSSNENILCVSPKNANPVIDIKVVDASLDPIPFLNLSFTVTSAVNYLRLLLFRSMSDAVPFFSTDRSWAVDSSNRQPTSFNSISSPSNFTAKFTLNDFYGGNDPAYACIQTWNYDSFAPSPCFRKMFYFQRVNPGAFLSASVVLQPDRQIQLNIKLSPKHYATTLAVNIFLCSSYFDREFNGLSLYTSAFPITECENPCEFVFVIPSMSPRACLQLEARLINRDLNNFSNSSDCAIETSCKLVIFSVPIIQFSRINRILLSRVFMNGSLCFQVSLSAAFQGWLGIRNSINASFSEFKSFSGLTIIRSGITEYDILFPSSTAYAVYSIDVALFDSLQIMFAIDTFNISVPITPVRAPSFYFSSFSNDVTSASLLLWLNVTELTTSRFHVAIWMVGRPYCGGILKYSMASCQGSQTLMTSALPIFVQNLVPSLQYCFSVRYSNAAGWSPWSDDNCSVFASSSPILRAIMVASNESYAIVYLAVKSFSVLKNVQIYSSHFAANLEVGLLGSYDDSKGHLFVSESNPERNFLLPLLINITESDSFNLRVFMTIQRPIPSLPINLDIKVIDESGNPVLHALELASSKVVYPPDSAFIRNVGSDQIYFQFYLSPSDAADIIGYEIKCSWPNSSAGSFCSCSLCVANTLLIQLPGSSVEYLASQIFFQQTARPSVFIRTLGFASHSEYIEASVYSDQSDLKDNKCSDVENIASLEGAFFNQDSGDVFIHIPPVLLNYSVMAEFSSLSTSDWILMNSFVQDAFVIFRIKTILQVFHVRLRAVDSVDCVFFTTSTSVQTLPPTSFLFPEYDVRLKQSSISILWAHPGSILCSPVVEVAYSQPCAQNWISISEQFMFNNSGPFTIELLISNLTSMLTAALSTAKMSLDDVAISNASNCANWFAIRSACSKLPLVFDINKRLPLSSSENNINFELSFDIHSYSYSAITAKITSGFALSVVNSQSSWMALANAGLFSDYSIEILSISSVYINEETGYIFLTINHAYPEMAFIRLQIIFEQAGSMLKGEVEFLLLPPPAAPLISWYYIASTTLRISWISSKYSQITMYRLRLSANDDGSDFREIVSNSSYVDIQNVSSNVSYRVFVSASNLHSGGFVFQSEYVISHYMAIPKPECLSVVEFNAGGVVISWCNPEYSQSISVVVAAFFKSSCYNVYVDAFIYIDPLQPLAILHGLNASMYDISVGFKTQDQRVSQLSHLIVYPVASICRCRINISIDGSAIETQPCPDLFLRSVKIVFKSGAQLIENPVATASASVTQISDLNLLPGFYSTYCFSEYFSGVIVEGLTLILRVPLPPVNNLRISFVNTSLVSLGWQGTDSRCTFNVSVKDVSLGQFRNFSSSNNSISIPIGNGRIYDVWVSAVLAGITSDSKYIAVSDVNTSALTVPKIALIGVYDSFIYVSWTPTLAVQNSAVGIFRYDFAAASVSDTGVIDVFSSTVNISNPATVASIRLPVQSKLYAIRLSVCVNGLNFCASQIDCFQGMRGNESGCLLAKTSPRPPPPSRISIGLYSRSVLDPRYVQVPLNWMPGSALDVLSYRVILSCDPCPAGTYVQSLGSALPSASKAILLNITTNSTYLLLNYLPDFPAVQMQLDMSASGINALGFGDSVFVEFSPALSCVNLPKCESSLVSIVSSNISSITLSLQTSPCGSNFYIEGAINGGGFYPVAPVISSTSTSLIQLTLIGGIPYYAPSDFVVFRYTVVAIFGLNCMNPSYFNTSSIILSRSLNSSQFFQAPVFSTLRVIRVTSVSALVSITGASLSDAIFATLALIMRDIDGDIIASAVIKRDDRVQFENLPPFECLYIDICSVSRDVRSTACTMSSGRSMPVCLHDPLAAPVVTLVNLTSALTSYLMIASCVSHAHSLQIFGISNGIEVMNMTIPTICPMPILLVNFPFCGSWNLKLQWMSAAGPGEFGILSLSISDNLLPPESLFAEVIISPFETPNVRVSWEPPNFGGCASNDELVNLGYDVTVTVDARATTTRVSSTSRSVILPLDLNISVGLAIIVSVQSVQIENNQLVVLSRPMIANASIIHCDSTASEVIADILQPPIASCNLHAYTTIISGPLSFPAGLIVPFKIAPSTINPELRGRRLNMTMISCKIGNCALLRLPQHGPIGTTLSMCIKASWRNVIVTWCMKLQFKFPLPILTSSKPNPIFTGVFCRVDVEVIAVGHSRLPKPLFTFSNFTQSSMLGTSAGVNATKLPEGMSIRQYDSQSASITWDVKFGLQGFLYEICFMARYPFPADSVFFPSAIFCVSITARPCSACVTSQFSLSAIASLWSASWITAWTSTPPMLFDNSSAVNLGPIVIASRDESGDGRLFSNRMGCTVSDLALWNPHAVDANGQLRVTPGEGICVVWKVPPS